MNSVKRLFPLVTLLLLLASSSVLQAADWLPISPEELAMKDNPAKPGSKAMVLYHSIERDDQLGSQTEYVRIKVFTEEGKSYGDVSVPPFDREFKIGHVQGRTVHPDGTIIPFNGQVFEKVVAQSRGFKLATKSFTLPDVTPGSILEYRYVLYWEAINPATRTYYYFPRSEWEVQGDLFQKTAHFVFKPARPDMFAYRMQATRLPEGAKFARDPLKGFITMDMANIPAKDNEPFMPPPDEMNMRVLFFYSTDFQIPTGDEFWKQHGKKWEGQVEGFMDKKGALQSALAGIVAPSDSPEVKLHKIYDYVQGLENLSYERHKSQQELRQLNLKEIKTVEDVLHNKYGFRSELNRTFVALARSAGVDATLVKVTPRDEALLHKDWPSFAQLGPEIALVKVGGKDLYLDPGSPYCPFGTLPWEDTGITGLVLTKNMPTWASTPLPDPSGAVMKRVAKLTLAEDGSVSGDVELTFLGQYAYFRRFRARDEDETERKKSMEEYLQNWLVVKGDVEFLGANDWNNSNLPFVAKFKVNLPGYASQVGKRTLLPGTFFAGSYRNPFTATQRVNPIYMEYSFDDNDDVTITLPKSFQVESLPKTLNDKNPVADLSADYLNDNGTLHFTREFRMKTLGIETKYYAAVRQYFQTVQAGANEQAVLKTAAQ